jgi:hypothetical protein
MVTKPRVNNIPDVIREVNPIPVRLAITGIEMTQATQFFNFNGQGTGFGEDNSVPLVANKATVLRVYVNHNPAFLAKNLRKKITGTVSYTFAGQTIALDPLNEPIPAPATNEIQRTLVADTINFLVPAAHCRETVIFTVNIRFVDNSGVPASQTIDGVFADVPFPRVHLVLLHVKADGFQEHQPPGCLEALEAFAEIGKFYPVGGFELTGTDDVTITNNPNAQGGSGCGAGFNPIRDLLLDMRTASGSDDIYVGILPKDQPLSSVQGCGGDGFAIGKANGFVLGHELGHAFGRSHAPCGVSSGLDPGYPDFPNLPEGSIGEVGFNTADLIAFDPAVSADVMSNCGNAFWISPYTYTHIQDRIAQDFNKRSVRALKRSSGELMALNFRLHRDNRLELRPSVTFYGQMPMMMEAYSGITCDLLDANGVSLCLYSCQISDSYQRLDGPYLDLHQTIPWSADVRSLAIRRNGRLVAMLPVPDKAPKLALTSMRRNKEKRNLMRLEWDGDHESPLTYLVRYSQDGGKTWRAVAAQMTEPKCLLDLDLLPGGKDCRIQVTATAGLTTSKVEMPIGQVSQKPRAAWIVTPKPNAVFTEGEPVVLSGGSFSPDFGMSDVDDICWRSDWDCILGSGPQIIVTNLAPGRHKITMSTTDGKGGTASETVMVTVEKE